MKKAIVFVLVVLALCPCVALSATNYYFKVNAQTREYRGSLTIVDGAEEVEQSYERYFGEVSAVQFGDGGEAAFNAVSGVVYAAADAWVANDTNTFRGPVICYEDLTFTALYKGPDMLATNNTRWLVSVTTGGVVYATQIASSPRISFEEQKARMAAHEARISKAKADFRKAGNLQQKVDALADLFGLR